jgi:hypothetical protein
MSTAPRRARLLLVALIASSGTVLHSAANAECPQAGLAAPTVAEFSLRAAEVYAAAVPPGATDDAKKLAADAAITSAQGAFMDVLTSTAVDAIAVSNDPQLEGAVRTAREIAQHMNEVARTDKQVGAAASVSGSTSAATKTGIPRILSLAVERGAVEREDSGTGATFSTSPYALLLLGKEDTDQNFNDYAYLRRVGVSATVDLDHSNSTGSGDFQADQISAVATSIRLFGDRSARTTEFVEAWNLRIAPLLTQHAEASLERNVSVLRANAQLVQVFVTGFAPAPREGEFRTAMREALVSKTTQAEAADAVARALHAKLCTAVVEPVANGTINLTGVDQAAVASAVRAVTTLNVSQAELEKLLNEFNSRPVVTFQHVWNRSDEGSDYSNFVLAADGLVNRVPFSAVALPLAPWSVLLNASLALNHNPEDDTNQDQDTIREFAVSGSLEKSMENPIRIGNEAETVSRISASVTGRYARQLDADANIGVFHARVAVPLVRGFSFVLALNYATRSETDSEHEVRLAGGLEFNGDTFAELADLQDLFAQRR